MATILRPETAEAVVETIAWAAADEVPVEIVGQAKDQRLCHRPPFHPTAGQELELAGVSLLATLIFLLPNTSRNAESSPHRSPMSSRSISAPKSDFPNTASSLTPETSRLEAIS